MKSISEEYDMEADLQHEYPLPQQPDVAFWSENFALLARDADTGFSMFYSIGTWYGDTTVWREVLGITLPGGRTLVSKSYGRDTKGAVVSGSLSRYEITKPLESVRLTFKGPATEYTSDEALQQRPHAAMNRALSLELDFAAATPLWWIGAHPKKEEGSKDNNVVFAGGLHTEQLGHCSGTVTVDGQTLEIRNAAATRDHSRGARTAHSYKNHCWIQCLFPGGRAFQLMTMSAHGVEGLATAHATVIDNNQLYPATVRQLTPSSSMDDLRKGQTIILDSELDEMRIEVKEIFASMPLSIVAPWDVQIGNVIGIPHALVFEESAIMEWNGKTGMGWYERGFSATRL